MKATDCMSAAQSNLREARRYLMTGEAVNRVPDSLRSALLWAMEGWLIAKGHHSNRGRGWEGTRELFLNDGPVAVRAQLMTCYAEARLLELELSGDFDNTGPALPMADWKIKAFTCLEKTEKAVGQLLADLESNTGTEAERGC